MNLPKIDLASLPDLDTLTGMFGSMRHQGGDQIVVLATVVYESSPPGGGLI